MLEVEKKVQRTSKPVKVNKVMRKAKKPAYDILNLQRSVGNQAVQRLFKSGYIQGKLTVGKPNDKYEQEADKVSDEVMRMPESKVQGQEEKEELVQTKPIGEQITPLVQRQAEPEEEEEEQIQAKADGQAPQVSSGIESKINSLQGGGQPLSKETRNFFEPRFGHDFSGVRVHNDSNAHYLAQSINARAFTKGNDIVFGGSEYNPESSSGKRLLGHELVHVRQQRNKTIQRTIDTSIQFDTYSLTHLHGIVPLTDTISREMENTAYKSFSARNPVTTMNLTDKWYYYNPLLTNALLATRDKWRMYLIARSFFSAKDVYKFNFKYQHTKSRLRQGSFAVSSGASKSRTETIQGGAKLTYSIVELNASASTANTTGRSSGTTVSTTNYYEHDYNVSLNYNISYYNSSDFTVKYHWLYGNQVHWIGGPHTLSGTKPIGKCSVKDDDSNPDNLLP